MLLFYISYVFKCIYNLKFLPIMVLILIGIIMILIVVIIYFNIQFYKEKELFRIKIQVLQNSIVEISKKQSGQANQIKLSEELEQSMKDNKAILNNDIFWLNYELFIILSKNNLI